MLTIGRGPRRVEGSEHPIDLLAACHTRIRAVLVALHALVAAGADEAAETIASTASFVDGYLRVALPLHAADEDESIAPRLRAIAPRLDAVLSARQGEHAAHRVALERVLVLTDEIARDPGQLPRLQRALAAEQAALDHALEAHLVEEERWVFPALALLSPAESDAIVREMRARRGTRSAAA